MTKTHTVVRQGLCSLAVVLACAGQGYAQTPRFTSYPVNLSGPRVGATFLSPGVADTLRDHQIDAGWALS